ncbi:hypothetical protein C8F01DRAFT_1248222 [Mycena amicta]|nr:hypothetical protein C8F01DRAFT_1248222 [Mycena amicta]
MASDLPLELLGSIVERLPKADIKSCGLVCRQWLAVSRSHLTFKVTMGNFDQFSAVAQSVNNTVLQTVQRLFIMVGVNYTKHPPLGVLLPQFSSLTFLSVTLSVWRPVDDLPPVASLTHVELTCKFTSYTILLHFLSGLPCLRFLALHAIDFVDVDVDGGAPVQGLPPLSLEGLKIGPRANVPLEMLAALRARRLHISYPQSRTSGEQLRRISDCFQSWKSHLTTVYMEPYVGPSNYSNSVQPPVLDLSPCSALTHVVMENAFVLAIDSDANGRESLRITSNRQTLDLMLRSAAASQVQTLSLTINMIRPSHLSDPEEMHELFIQLLESSQFSALWKLEIVFDGVVYGFGRYTPATAARWETQVRAMLPASLAQRVVCVDGEDWGHRMVSRGSGRLRINMTHDIIPDL